MFPKKILTSFAVAGICDVNLELLASNWHSGARIEKHKEANSKNVKYLLIEKSNLSNEIILKVKISEKDALAIISRLRLSEFEDDFNNDVTIYK